MKIVQILNEIYFIIKINLIFSLSNILIIFLLFSNNKINSNTIISYLLASITIIPSLMSLYNITYNHFKKRQSNTIKQYYINIRNDIKESSKYTLVMIILCYIVFLNITFFVSVIEIPLLVALQYAFIIISLLYLNTFLFLSANYNNGIVEMLSNVVITWFKYPLIFIMQFVLFIGVLILWNYYLIVGLFIGYGAYIYSISYFFYKCIAYPSVLKHSI